MYYWIIILFSLASIMTYKMAGTDGKFEKRIAPVMESAAAEIVQQHKAALKYVNANPDYTYTRTNQELSPDLYAPYAASGWNKSAKKYKTVIMCISFGDYNVVKNCKSTDGINFLVTYGEFPERWDEETVKPYFFNILSRYAERTDQIGIVEKVLDSSVAVEGPVQGSQYVLNSILGKNVYLPQMFLCVDNNFEPENSLMYVTQLTNTTKPNAEISSVTSISCSIPIGDPPINP